MDSKKGIVASAIIIFMLPSLPTKKCLYIYIYIYILLFIKSFGITKDPCDQNSSRVYTINLFLKWSNC